MKHLKLFEEFTDNQISYVSVKMQEIQDILPSNTNFEYHIDSISKNSNIQSSLEINLVVFEDDSKYSWIVDIDTPHIIFKSKESSYNEDVSSVDEALDIIEKQIYSIFGISEKVKSQRYKGHKIPGKYLTKNPGKMKKEIDTFRGKKVYKKDWDADYKSGKGGVGKRVKTKKSAATKAYQKMFGNK